MEALQWKDLIPGTLANGPAALKDWTSEVILSAQPSCLTDKVGRQCAALAHSSSGVDHAEHASWASHPGDWPAAGNLIGDRLGMSRMALKCDVAGVGEDLDRVDGAWGHSCVVGIRRREAKDATWGCHILALAWAEK
jgi:hypothetical protein